ncbi:hypothetical protein GCK72_004028 [Caenorhabditis remanei]|uniref:Uncharacterized protein n=1 Tax=Caenorhabditis remanei TaxID=31234 RepID=A0A6A5HCH3_CAERE|nr:hypothetical protein GCK72_004028 [Caenorhabditis remanei]KAF1764082.1 hypothetical protein GCK72_004028 [Caenorhabditis remanei]
MQLPPLPPTNPLAKLYALAKRKTVKLQKDKKLPLRIRCINWNFYEKLRLEFKGTAPARKRRSHDESGGGSPVKKQAKMEDVGSQKTSETPDVAEQENINSAPLWD